MKEVLSMWYVVDEFGVVLPTAFVTKNAASQCCQEWRMGDIRGIEYHVEFRAETP